MTQLSGSKKNMEALNKALDQLVKDALAVGDSTDDVAKAQRICQGSTRFGQGGPEMRLSV